MATFVEYLKNYSANLVPVIPAKAQLSPRSTIHPDKVGKVPGIRRAHGWVGLHWRELRVITHALAKVWDGMGAAIGFRCGPENLFAIDIDLTHEEDAQGVLSIALALFGDVAIRRVDHPDHHKLLICARLVGEMPRSFDMAVNQSDGKHAKIQFLGEGRYFNVEGVHPGRVRPYVWNQNPAVTRLIEITRQTFDEFWERLGRDFDAVKTVHAHSAFEVKREPERCSQEKLEHFLSMIPNDEQFETYDSFIAMGSAIWGASGGEPWGRLIWIDWCDQIPQDDPDKPEQFWDTMRKARIGAEMLRRWAQVRQPQAMAKHDFEDPPDLSAIGGGHTNHSHSGASLVARLTKLMTLWLVVSLIFL
jgi:hypothetical protein